MKAALTIITCLTFSLFSVGCYSLNAIDMNEKNRLPERRNIYLIEKKNNEVVRCKADDVDSSRVTADQIELYHNGAAVRTVAIDSVKSVYTKDFNTIGTITLGGVGLGLLLIGVYVSILRSIRT